MSLILAAIIAVAQPTPKPSPAPVISVSGRVRAYNFARWYQTGATSQQATSAAVRLHFETVSRKPFSLAYTYYSAYPIGSAGIAPANLEPSLPGVRLTTTAEAYAQYRTGGLTVRAGRQILSTPWTNPGDSRLVPIAFDGASVAGTLAHGWSISALRMISVKNRTATGFAGTNFVSNVPNAGFAALGAARGTTSMWYYKFSGVATMLYGETARTWKIGHARLGAQAQYASENATSGLLGRIASHLYGARLSAGAGLVDVAVAYDRIPNVVGAYRNGALVSPYTFGDNNDPLFATGIGATLIDKASAGQALYVTATYTSSNKRLKLILGQVRDELLAGAVSSSLSENDADLAYAIFVRKNGQSLWLHERAFAQKSPGAPYTYGQSRFYFDYTW